jgi:hypothetical protein
MSEYNPFDPNAEDLAWLMKEAERMQNGGRNQNYYYDGQNYTPVNPFANNDSRRTMANNPNVGVRQYAPQQQGYDQNSVYPNPLNQPVNSNPADSRRSLSLPPNPWSSVDGAYLINSIEALDQGIFSPPTYPYGIAPGQTQMQQQFMSDKIGNVDMTSFDQQQYYYPAPTIDWEQAAMDKMKSYQQPAPEFPMNYYNDQNNISIGCEPNWKEYAEQIWGKNNN